MRVAIVLPGISRRPSGGYRVAYEYANSLARRGHQVSCYHLRPSKPIDRNQTRTRAHAVTVGYRLLRSSRPTWFALDPDIRVLNASLVVGSTMDSADVYIATSVRTAPIVASATLATGAAGVYLIQGYEDFVADSRFVDATWRLPLTRVVVSNGLLAIGERLGAPCTLIENAVDTSMFAPSDFPSQRTIEVAAMVSVERHKRTDLVVEIYKRLLKADPDLRLATFGTCSRPVGLPSAVKHLRSPTRQKLADLLRSSRVYLCASDQEGFGLPVLEAMASGAGVVSTRNGGVETFAGETARLAAAGDLDGLFSQVVESLTDPSDTALRAKAGMLIARSRSLEANHARFEEILLSIVGGGA